MVDANLLDARGLTKLRAGRKIVDSVNLQVNRGEIVALLGRHKSGKSTTLRMITGDLKPDDGVVRVHGTVFTDYAQTEGFTGPAILILDEPFSSLDPLKHEELKSRILRLAGRGLGVLFAEHDVRGSLDFCDRAYVMADGRIATSGSASGLVAPQ